MLPTVPFPDFVQQVEKLSGNQKLIMKQMSLEQNGDEALWETESHAQPGGHAVADDWGDIESQLQSGAAVRSIGSSLNCATRCIASAIFPELSLH